MYCFELSATTDSYIGGCRRRHIPAQSEAEAVLSIVARAVVPRAHIVLGCNIATYAEMSRQYLPLRSRAGLRFVLCGTWPALREGMVR